MKYAAQRVLHAVFLLLGVSLLSFLFADLAPGDFFSELRLDNPGVSAETIAALRAQYGLDRPLPVRYGVWLAAVAHGEFGYSLAYRGPVGPLLSERMRGEAGGLATCGHGRSARSALAEPLPPGSPWEHPTGRR